MNSVASKNAIAVRASSSGVGATARRSDMRHRSVISSRSRRRTSRSSDGVRRGSSSRSSRAAQRRSATSAVRRRASVGWAVRTRVTDRRPSSSSISGSVRPARRERADGLGHRIVEDAVARRPLAAPERPDPAPRLDEVDELEVEREGPDDRLGRPEIEAAQVLVETAPLVGVVVLPQRDRPPADPLDELEQLRAGLFGDDLAEQRAHQADLGGERVRARRTCRSRPARPARPPTGRAARATGLTTANLADRTGSQPFPGRNLSRGSTFPTLVR